MRNFHDAPPENILQKISLLNVSFKGSITTPVIEGKMVKFTPALIRVADMDAAEVLKNAKSGNGNIIAMALMPLMKNCTKEKMVELIDTEARINSEGLRNDVIVICPQG